jgi:GTP-binding protein Era
MALAKAKIEIILVLNKVDLVKPKSDLLDTTRDLISLINGIKLPPEQAEQATLDTTTFMISALENDGVLDMKNYFINIAEPKPWLIHGTDHNAFSNLLVGKAKRSTHPVTNLTTEERVEQAVLENLLDNTHEEIPYVASIECKLIAPMNHRKIRIDADILVDTRGQQKIIVGQHGRTLVKIR